jgi:hypothetical protein
VRKSAQLIWIELVAAVKLSLFIRFGRSDCGLDAIFTERDYSG